MANSKMQAVRTCPTCGAQRIVSSSTKRPITRLCRRCHLTDITRAHHAARHAGRLARQASVDPYIVDLLVMGMRERGTRAEMTEAVRRLAPRRWSSSKLAAHLGVTPRSIQRYKAALRAESSAAA